MIEETRFAREAARMAGDYLLALQRRGDLGGRALGARGDREANALILRMLRDRFPDDAVLSEESADDSSRLTQSRLWIIDPLDGTREYSEGRDDWAVHVGLAIDGAAAAGAVALPALGLVLASDEIQRPPAARARPRIVVSRTRPPALGDAVAAALDGDIVAMGSAGAKAMAVVRGEAEIYLHEGGQREWDNCAPIAVAQAAGLHCSSLGGAPFTYNNRDPLCGSLLICRAQYADRIIDLAAALPG
ncbi:MAG: 3'(2'),5'-bisphosphate nucleotidase CysQ [Sphingomonadales bacterium]|nr:3'(2'),5'-bisphosphate nucleotidase CysQ [Sphingomonadales bacterium]